MSASNTNTGTFAFLRQLVTDGIPCIFGNPGSSEENLLDALSSPEFANLSYYLALQEGTVVGMADAYARAAPARQLSTDRVAWRRPAIVQLHSYAGLANGLGMIYYARRGYTPMVVFVGEAGLRYDAMDGQMAADLCSIVRPFVKSDQNGPCAWRVVDSGSVLRLLRRAIKTAATPPMGPVFLALPMDVLDLPNTEAVQPSQPVFSSVHPDDDAIEAATHLLMAASNPLILMGDGIAAAGAQAELVAVAEQLGAVVWGGNCSEVNMPASHPLFGGYLGHMFGADSKPILSAADAVLVCGTTVLPEVFPSLDGVFSDTAKVIQFDLNSYEIGKNFPVAIGAIADPRKALESLAEALRRGMSTEQQQHAQNRLRQRQAAKLAERGKAIDKDARLRDHVPLHGSRFMADLAERLSRLPEPALIFDEALTHSPELTRYIPQDSIGTYFQTRVGMLGTGLPGTLGLKVARPDRTVFGFSGDGGSMSTIQALSTAARHNIGAKFVVCNNRSYRILKYNLQTYRAGHGIPPNPAFPASFDLTPPTLRFDQLAEAQGVAAARVERPEDIAPALNRALADDRPFLIDLVLDSHL
jgi:thiamine pyrophosphate-dependent acetolactate synthase large subunit-like protein